MDGQDRDGSFYLFSVRSFVDAGSPWLLDQKLTSNEASFEMLGFLNDTCAIFRDLPSGNVSYFSVKTSGFKNPIEKYQLRQQLVMTSEGVILLSGLEGFETRNVISGEVLKTYSQAILSHTPLSVFRDGSEALVNVDDKLFICQLQSGLFKKVNLKSMDKPVALATAVTNPRGFVLATG